MEDKDTNLDFTSLGRILEYLFGISHYQASSYANKILYAIGTKIEGVLKIDLNTAVSFINNCEHYDIKEYNGDANYSIVYDNDKKHTIIPLKGLIKIAYCNNCGKYL